MEQQVYHCLRYRGLAPLSCSDEFACHGVVMNGRKAEEMCCGLIRSGKVKSGLAACLRLQPHRSCDPTPSPTDVQVYVHISVANSSVSWSVSKTTTSAWHLFWQGIWFHQHVSRSQDTEDSVHCFSSTLLKRVCWKVRYSLSTRLQLKISTFDLMLDKKSIKIELSSTQSLLNVITSNTV